MSVIINPAKGGGGRTILTTATDYYISADTGNDANNGSIGSPWATLQHAITFLQDLIDFGNQRVTLHVADSASTYAGAQWGSFVGSGILVILGNNTTLGNVKVGNSVGPFGTLGAFFSGGGNTTVPIWISGFDMVPTSGPCVDCDGADKGVVIFGEPTFTITTRNRFSSCQNHSYVIIGNVFDSTLGISEINATSLAARNPAAFIIQLNTAPQDSILFLSDFTITGGPVTFSRAFAVAAADGLQIYGSPAGAANVIGRRFEVEFEGELIADSTISIPGTIPGTCEGSLAVGGFPNKVYLGPSPLTNSFQTPVNGFTITIGDAIGKLILNPAGELESGTITLPPNPIDGQIVQITSSQLIQLLQLFPNAGQSIIGTAVSLTTSGRIYSVFNASNSTWYVTTYGPPFPAMQHAGAPNNTDVPSGFWRLIRDTVNSTTGLYYNNAGVLQVVYLSNVPGQVYVPTYYLYGF